MDAPDEHRARWERWFERAGAPGFRVVSWTSNEGFYQILLVKEDETGKQSVTYTWEV